MPSVLITGVSRGIGRALVEHYAERGWTVFALLRSAMACPENVIPIIADVREDGCGSAIVRELEKRTQGLDVLINNAGIAGTGKDLASVDTDEMINLFQTHCLGALRCAKASLPYLKRAARPTIVNITSRLGSLTWNASRRFADERHSYAYRVAKASLNMLSICMALDLEPAGVRVLTLHPGTVRTRLGSTSGQFSAREAAVAIVQLIETSQPTLPVFLGPDGSPIEW